MSLKDQNRIGLWAVTAANFVLFTIMARPSVAVGDFQALASHWLPMLPAGLGLIAVSVINAQVSGLTKATLVFWRLRDPLPASEAFSKLGPADPRVDMAALSARHGPLPDGAADQNALWFRLYQSVEHLPAVEQVHREYLFTRDYCFLAALMLVGLVPLSIVTFTSALSASSYAAILFLQFLLTGQAARNHGRRLVSTVLARKAAEEDRSPAR